MRVAVIDSGITAGHPHVQGVAGGIALSAGDDHNDFADDVGHGTAVAAAIREKAPAAELFAVKVFGRSLAATVSSLVRAIDWSIEQQCDLINMSLGTPILDHEAPLRAAVDRARARGALLVAAREEDGRRFLPGSLTGVLGVVVDWHCPRQTVRVGIALDRQVICFASGYPREIPGVPPAHNLKGVSFAVANTTGFFANLLQQGPAGRASIAALIASPVSPFRTI